MKVKKHSSTVYRLNELLLVLVLLQYVAQYKNVTALRMRYKYITFII